MPEALAERMRPAPAAAAGAPPASARRPPPRRERRLLLAVAALAALAWLSATTGSYAPGTGLGYALGVSGGAAMLVVLLYPLRKHLRAARAWGPSKYWFAVHMACGIAGPLLILAHSRLRVGSVNAGVALASMLLVMASGIVGRFIYVRIHHGLYGTHATLRELQAQLGLSSQEVQSQLAFAPRVERWLEEFTARALARPAGAAAAAWSFLAMGSRARATGARCRREIKQIFRARARARGWERAKYRRRLAAATRLVEVYLYRVQRVAQFAAYERLFSLWHVLHVPLVWLLVLSAVAHVIAVHAY